MGSPIEVRAGPPAKLGTGSATSPWPQQSRYWSREQNGPHRLGRLEILNSVPVLSSTCCLTGSADQNISHATARFRFELMDEPVRPAWGKADNTPGHLWPVQRLAPRARIPSWPGALHSIAKAGDT